MENKPNSGMVCDFDAFAEPGVSRVMAAAQQIGGQLLQASNILKEAFDAERRILIAMSNCKARDLYMNRIFRSLKPDIENLKKLVEPINESMIKIKTMTEAKKSENYNHLKTVEESILGLAWVMYSGKECAANGSPSYLQECLYQQLMWIRAGNAQSISITRNKDPNHVEWAKAMRTLLVPSCKAYVEKFHSAGPSWNDEGISVLEFLRDPSKYSYIDSPCAQQNDIPLDADLIPVTYGLISLHRHIYTFEDHTCGDQVLIFFDRLTPKGLIEKINPADSKGGVIPSQSVTFSFR
eukprot:Gb_25556 [translate_table: standard]